eukprot:3147677-Pyramimonas_sp.AAC.1
MRQEGSALRHSGRPGRTTRTPQESRRSPRVVQEVDLRAARRARLADTGKTLPQHPRRRPGETPAYSARP